MLPLALTVDQLPWEDTESGKFYWNDATRYLRVPGYVIEYEVKP